MAARLHARMRCDAMLDRSDLDGRDVWQRVIRAIDALQAMEPMEEDSVH